MSNELLLTPEKVCEVLSLSRSKVYELLRKGELKSVRVGSSRRITQQQVMDFVNSLEIASPDEDFSNQNSEQVLVNDIDINS